MQQVINVVVIVLVSDVYNDDIILISRHRIIFILNNLDN